MSNIPESIQLDTTMVGPQREQNARQALEALKGDSMQMKFLGPLNAYDLFSRAQDRLNSKDEQALREAESKIRDLFGDRALEVVDAYREALKRSEEE